MTSERQFSLLPKSSDEMRSPLHGLEAIARELADFADGVEAQVGDLMFFKVGPDRLDRVQVRGIGWQLVPSKVALLLFKPSLDLAAAMGRDTVPDDQQRPLNLALERAEEFDDLFGTDGIGKEAEVELPEGQPSNRRKLLPGKAVLEYGRLPPQAPGACHVRAFAQSGFVDEDDGTAFPLGFFLSAGQVCRFQRAISASLRWVARFSGFWQEKPIRRSRCHRWPVLYSTPKRSAITLPMRGSVHSSVAYPAAKAPAMSTLPNSRSCTASSWRGRPSSPRLSAFFPPSAKRSSQAATVCRATPSCRATSDLDTPRPSSFAPSSRRFSNALKSRLCLTVAPRNEHKQINVFNYHGVDSYLYESQ